MKKIFAVIMALLMVSASSIVASAWNPGLFTSTRKEKSNCDTVEIILDGVIEEEENPTTGAPVFAVSDLPTQRQEIYETVEIILDGVIEDENPDTGAPVFGIFTGAAAIVAAALYLGKKK